LIGRLKIFFREFVFIGVAVPSHHFQGRAFPVFFWQSVASMLKFLHI